MKQKSFCKLDIRVYCGWKHADANRQSVQQRHALGEKWKAPGKPVSLCMKEC